MYENDTTESRVNGEEMGRMEGWNGIRQGCMCSLQLFIRLLGFRNDSVYVPAFFFADDGVILGKSVREIERMMDVLEMVIADLGMAVNKNKCNVLVFNRRVDVNSIRGMNVVKTVKYLGVKVGTFLKYIERM